MATPEKPKKSVSFAVERPREEEIKRDTKSLFIVRQRPEVFADSKLIRPKFSSPSMNLSTMYLNASDESDSAESESEDMEEEEVLEVALKSEDSMDVDREHSNTSSSWQPFEPIIESPEPEPEVEPDPEPMIVEYSPASESGIIRKYVVSEDAMQEGSPSDSSVGIAPPSPGSSSSNLSNSSSATPSYSGSRSGSSTSNDSKTTEHSSITASSTTTDRTDLSSRTGQSIESSLTSGTYSSYTSGRTGTSGTTYSSYTTDMTHSTMTTGSTMPSFGSSEFSTDAYTSTLTGSLSRSDSGSRTESATTESKYSTSNAKSSSDTVISAQVPQSEGPAETKRRKAHEVEPPTPPPSSASEQSYSSQTSETEGKSMTVPPPNSSKYVSEVIEPQITQAQMAQIGQGRIAADDGKLTVGSFHSAESKFSYTTPSILLEKKEIEEANDSLLDYTTPSRLHQKIISRDINEKPHITESIKSYTTPSALFRKKEEIEGVDSLQDNKTATTLVEQTVGREQIERVALQSPTSNIRPSQISTENDKIVGEPPHIRGTHGSHITPSSSSSSVEVVPEPERTEHTLDPNFGEKYPYLQKTLGAKDSSPNDEFKMSFKKSDTSSSGHVTRKEKEETYGTQMDESGRKSTTATPHDSVTPASSFDFVTDSDLPSPAQAELLFRRASSGPVYQESSSGTLPDVYTESDESMPPGVSFVSAPTPTIPYDSELDVEVDSRAQSYDICLPTSEQATQEKAETKTVPLKAQSVYVSPVKRHIYGSINQPYSLPSVPVYSVMHRMPAAGDLHHKRPEFLHDYVTEALTLDKTKGVVGKIIPTVIDMEISTDETEREQQEAEGESKRQIGETDLKTDSKQMADKDLEINQQTDRNGQQERSDDSDEIETVSNPLFTYQWSCLNLILTYALETALSV
ncbi:uncharacterized protein [Ptychodera flava]|uniref:uncharacterized protein n=1 Tax=Ptychodera flava TaxID=63121 RepID=UPI00396A2FC1